MNKKMLIALLLSSAMKMEAQQVSVLIDAVSPVTYKADKGKLKLMSYIKLSKEVDGTLAGKLDGTALELVATSRKDSFLVWLPLIGEQNRIEIACGKQPLVNQTVKPMIPSDWGYFQNGTIHLIQSSHQDIGWMDTPDYCREDRINGIIIPALDLMKANKNFTFEMEQTLNLMEFLDAHPERKEEIIQLYKEKRFTWGATYNQPYEGLSTGEQLVRQSYYGRKWVKENLPGCDDRVANNMDVPGRTMQMPQILAKSGIPHLFVSRMGEGLYDWHSPDGSSVLTFSPGNYGWASMIWKFFDNDAVTAFNKLHHRTLLWSDYFKQYNIPPHYAILMSCDATKPVDYQAIVDEWNALAEQSEIPLPRLKNSTSEEYFEAVAKGNGQFEKVSGERPDLWLYIHGPAHYEATCFKREAGILLPAAETFTSFAGLLKKNLATYPRTSFDRAWMASIYPDHGLGGKNGEITDKIFQDSLLLAKDMGQSLLNSSLAEITSLVDAKQNSWVVYNDLTWERTEPACVEVSFANAIVRDGKGRVIPSQIIKGKEGKYQLYFMAENIPSLGYSTYTIAEGKGKTEVPVSVSSTTNAYENDYYKILLGNGGITSLYDKDLGKELVHTSKFQCGDILEAGYTGHGAGEFTRLQDLTPGDITTLSALPAQWRVAESGSLFTSFENVQQTKSTRVRQTVKCYHALKKIDFNIVLEDFNGEHNRQYRIAFPLNMMGTRTINYEVPMGVLEVGKDEMKKIPKGWAWGGTYVHHPEDSHPREIQNFMSAHGNGFGFTMSSCVAVGDWIDPSREQADYPVLQGILLSSHKSCHGEGNWYHQTGTHQFSFSVSSHKEGWENGYQFGIAANHPLRAVQKINKGGNLESTHSFMSLSDPLVALSLVKKADSDENLIIRLTEMEGKDKSVTLTLPIAAKKVIRTNLVEEEEEVLSVSGQTITLKIGHHAIETFKIIL